MNRMRSLVTNSRVWLGQRARARDQQCAKQLALIRIKL